MTFDFLGEQYHIFQEKPEEKNSAKISHFIKNIL